MMRFTLPLMICLVLFSCGQLRSEKKTDVPVATDNPCLLAFATTYDQALTKEMVAAATGVGAETMTTGHNRIHTDTKYHSVAYSWKGSLQKTVGGMTFPMDDYVKLTGIAPISQDRFELSYRAVTGEEAREAVRATGEAIEGNSGNEKLKEAVEKLEDMGYTKAQQREMIEGFAGSAQQLTAGFTALADLGQAATWNANTHTLYVFQNGALFQLVVELSEGERDLEVASLIARQLLEKCE